MQTKLHQHKHYKVGKIDKLANTKQENNDI